MDFSDKIRQAGANSGTRPGPAGRLFLAAAWMVLFLLAAVPGAAGKKVAVFDFDDRGKNPDELGRHIEAKLKEAFFDIHVDHFSGLGDEKRSVGILSAIEKNGYDLAIVRTSNALIMAQHILFHTPTLYTNASNPLSLGFRTLAKPGGNISGASYYIPVINHLRVYKAIQPSLSRPGFIFDVNNQSRKVEVSETRQACADLNMTCDFEFVEQDRSLAQAASALLARGADAIVAASSGVVYEHIDRFLHVADNARVPVFSFYKTGVFMGAVAALSSDFFKMADEILLPMAEKVLRQGLSPGDMPAGFLKKNRLFVNVQQMDKLGLKLPEQLLTRLEVIRVQPPGPRGRTEP